MVSQQERTKRRVALAKEQERQVRADAKRQTRKQRRRQLIVGGVVGFLALALIAPLTAGLLLDGSGAELDALPTSTTVPPTLVDPVFAGAALSGPTPCPAADGTEQRTTSFEQAPEFCIDPANSYAMALDTSEGEIVIELDADTAPTAANLAVVFARYGVYDSARATSFIDGLTVIGSLGSAGFTEPADPAEAPEDGIYPVGSVVMFTKLDGGMEGQLAIVSTQAAADALAEDPTHPIIGMVADPETASAIDGAAATELEFRIGDVTVTETTG